MIATIIRSIPDRETVFKIPDSHTTIIVPIFVYLKIAINCAAKKIITKSIPKLLNCFVNF